MCNCKTCVDEIYAEIREEMNGSPEGLPEFGDYDELAERATA